MYSKGRPFLGVKLVSLALNSAGLAKSLDTFRFHAAALQHILADALMECRNTLGLRLLVLVGLVGWLAGPFGAGGSVGDHFPSSVISSAAEGFSG